MDSSKGKHTTSLRIYWVLIGLGIGIIIGDSTKEWVISLIAGVLMGAAMAAMATKQGVDQ